MNDKQLEEGARHYCRLSRQDPEEPVTQMAADDSAMTGFKFHTVPRWQMVANELRSHALIQEALEWGRTSQP